MTDARHGTSSSAILKFQSGSLLLYHMASHSAGKNLRHSRIDFLSIFFSDVIICLYSMPSPMVLLCLPTPMTLASGGGESPMFPLVVH